MTTSRDQLAVLLRCDPLLPVTGPISAWIQSGPAEEQDEKAGADQNQHDAMVGIVAGRAWAATCRTGRDTNEHTAERDQVRHQRPSPFDTKMNQGRRCAAHQ